MDRIVPLASALTQLLELDALDLPDDLREAVLEGRRISAHGARVRQRLYIGKLLRRIDVEPILAALARRAEVDRQRNADRATAEQVGKRRGRPVILVIRAAEMAAAGHPFFYAGWGRDVIGMVLDAATDWAEVDELLTESYCVLAPKKLVALVDRPD